MITVSDKEIAVIQKKVSPIVREASLISVTDAASMAIASEMRSKLKAIEKEVVGDKEKLTKPLKQVVKDITAKYAPFENELDNALLIITNKMSTYQTAELKRAQEEEEKIAARVGEGKGKFKMETAVSKIEEIDKPDSKVGNTKFRTDKKFEVMDITLVPYEFVLPNEVAIRKAMIEGVEVAGVRYYEVQTPVNTR